MRRRDAVLWFSIFDWWTSSHGHSDFQLARHIARTRPVLFINTMGMRVPLPGRTERAGRRVLRKLGSVARGLREPDPALPDLAVLTPLSPPVSGAFGRLGHGASKAQARVALARLGWDPTRAVVTVPSAAILAKQLCGDRVLYYRSDAHGSFPHISAAAARGEAELLDHASLVVYAARHLAEREAARTGARARVLEHAVDPLAFHPGAVPDPEIRSLPGPRIGFFGSLRDHGVDFSLLAEVARAFPNASVIVMGDRLDEAKELAGPPNLRSLPPRSHARMPFAWTALDVALLPYRMTDWTWAIDPIKLREILASGCRVAAMPIPAVLPFRDTIFVAEGRENFIDAVRRALESGRPRIPSLPTWETQARCLSNWLDDL